MEDVIIGASAAYKGASAVTLASISDLTSCVETLGANHVGSDLTLTIRLVAHRTGFDLDLGLLQLVRRTTSCLQGAPTCDPAQLVAAHRLVWLWQADRADILSHCDGGVKFEDR